MLVFDNYEIIATQIYIFATERGGQSDYKL